MGKTGSGYFRSCYMIPVMCIFKVFPGLCVCAGGRVIDGRAIRRIWTAAGVGRKDGGGVSGRNGG